MPQITNIPVSLSDSQGHRSTTSLECREWTKSDGRSRALRWGGAVVGIAFLMLPIPIIHFAIIPVVLFGAPTVAFAVYKTKRRRRRADVEGAVLRHRRRHGGGQLRAHRDDVTRAGLLGA